VNRIGSYECECLEGFKKVDEFQCEDIGKHNIVRFELVSVRVSNSFPSNSISKQMNAQTDHIGVILMPNVRIRKAPMFVSVMKDTLETDSNAHVCCEFHFLFGCR
jgi:hypothetical protein